ncbi:hypothetical protein AACH28_20140 [Sphingobacterium thalpophilum]|uniref:Uncharacterized protein n=1 Tax=Sphingobacterium thalpophilum TaxID=259 RepID=A0ACD5BZF1_9SPHI
MYFVAIKIRKFPDNNNPFFIEFSRQTNPVNAQSENCHGQKSGGVSQATNERGENDLASFWLYHGVIGVILALFAG